jgi:hypothetical protein
MPRRSLSPAQQRVHKPDKSMAQKWRQRCGGVARSRRSRQAGGNFRNDDRVLCDHHWSVRVAKRRCEMFAVLRIRAPASKGFEQSVMAVTGWTARYSCAQHRSVSSFSEIPNTCPNQFRIVLDRIAMMPLEHFSY